MRTFLGYQRRPASCTASCTTLLRLSFCSVVRIVVHVVTLERPDFLPGGLDDLGDLLDPPPVAVVLALVVLLEELLLPVLHLVSHLVLLVREERRVHLREVLQRLKHVILRR